MLVQGGGAPRLLADITVAHVQHARQVAAFVGVAPGSATVIERVRYESAGRANTCLVLEDDTTHTLACATRWFRLLKKGIPLQTRGIRTRYACLVLYHCSTLPTLSL